jgi:hypothetical protein
VHIPQFVSEPASAPAFVPPANRRPMARRAMAGLIITVLVLGFMMAISTSHLMLTQTERQGIHAAEHAGRAQAAAEAGLFYYLSLVNATSTTFLTTPADCRKRLHFLGDPTMNNSAYVGVPPQQIGIWTGGTPVNGTFSTIEQSTWLFPEVSPFIPPVAQDVASSSIFMVKTYADTTSAAVLASYVYVKSLGVYRLLEGDTVMATFAAQLQARVEVFPVTKRVIINRFRFVPVEDPTDIANGPFHTRLTRPWD